MAHCTDAFGRSWNHMSRLLFQPFRFFYWIKMTLLVFVVNGLSSLNIPIRYTEMFKAERLEKLSQQVLNLLPVLLIGFVVLVLFTLLMGFLSCAARMLFYEGVRHGVIYYWETFLKQSIKIVTFFLWNIIAMLLAGLFAMIGLVVIFIFLTLAGGMAFVESSEAPNMTVLVIGVTLLIGFFLFLLILLIFYVVLLDSFVVPLMLVRDQGIFTAWARAIRLALENLWEFLGYVALRIGIGIFFVLVMFVVGLFMGLLTFLLAFPIFGGYPLGIKAALVLSIFLLPVSFAVTLVLLPIPIFQDAFALTFLRRLTGDRSFEPQGLDEPEAESPFSKEFASPPPSYPPTSGPIHFREIPPEPDDSASSSKGETPK